MKKETGNPLLTLTFGWSKRVVKGKALLDLSTSLLKFVTHFYLRMRVDCICETRLRCISIVRQLLDWLSALQRSAFSYIVLTVLPHASKKKKRGASASSFVLRLVQGIGNWAPYRPEICCMYVRTSMAMYGLVLRIRSLPIPYIFHHFSSLMKEMILFQISILFKYSS